jgi:DNA repair exonuclease SbcCD ATPase subunit
VSFKGLTSTLLLITVIGMALGVMAEDYMATTIFVHQEDAQMSDEGSSSTVLALEDGADDEQLTSIAASTANGTADQTLAEEQNANGDPSVPTDLERREAELATWETRLRDWENELTESERSLQEWEARLVDQARSLQTAQDYLTEQTAALQEERDLFTREWENLRADQTAVADLLAQLQEAQRLLQVKQADVAQREQEAHDLWLLSMATLSLGILVGLISISVVVVLIQRHRRIPGKVAVPTPALKSNGNGRPKREDLRASNRIIFKQPTL